MLSNPYRYDDIENRLDRMKKSESSTYKRPLRLPAPFNGLWRQQIIEWMYTLVHYCDLRHESAAAAAFYLDIVVSRGLVKTVNDYQLVAMTALYIALKIYDSPSMRIVKLSSLVKLGSGDFGEQDVIEMEFRILCALDWKMNVPTPNCYLHQYLLLLPNDIPPETRSKIEGHSLRVIEAAISKEFFASIDSSVLAYAAMLSTFERMTQSDMGVTQLQEFLTNMTRITKLESNSYTLLRYTSMLDRSINKTQDATNRYLQREDCGDFCKKQYPCERCIATTGNSPNNIAMELD